MDNSCPEGQLSDHTLAARGLFKIAHLARAEAAAHHRRRRGELKETFGSSERPSFLRAARKDYFAGTAWRRLLSAMPREVCC
jgi:hypothetical protein